MRGERRDITIHLSGEIGRASEKTERKSEG